MVTRLLTLLYVVITFVCVRGCIQSGDEFNRKYERFKLSECLHETGQLAVCDQRYPTHR